MIGKRTWGGLVGISHFIPLVDGGVVTMPDFGMWDPATSEWLIENHGTEPDIEVDIKPQDWAAGRDPQMERGIQELMRIVRERKPRKPKFDKRPRLAPPRLRGAPRKKKKR